MRGQDLFELGQMVNKQGPAWLVLQKHVAC